MCLFGIPLCGMLSGISYSRPVCHTPIILNVLSLHLFGGGEGVCVCTIHIPRDELSLTCGIGGHMYTVRDTFLLYGIEQGSSYPSGHQKPSARMRSADGTPRGTNGPIRRKGGNVTSYLLELFKFLSLCCVNPSWAHVCLRWSCQS